MRQKINGRETAIDAWLPSVISVNGLTGEGSDDLCAAIRTHFDFLQSEDNMQQRLRHMYSQRIYREAIDIITQSFAKLPDQRLSETLDKLLQHDITPSQAARLAMFDLK